MPFVNPQDDTRVMTLAHTLSEKGEKLTTLVIMKLRQMARLLAKNKDINYVSFFTAGMP